MKKYISLFCIFIILELTVSGCSLGKKGRTITFALENNLRNLDPALSNTEESDIIVLHSFEGLTRVDKGGKTVAGTALKWEKSQDGLKYTFYINKDAKWSDGEPVTAHDFEYAWKRVLDPRVASENAFYLYYIKNAKGYNMSDYSDYKGAKYKRDDVGIKALDDFTLEVTLESPCAYWIDLTNLPVYMPVRKDIIEQHAQEWSRKESTYIGNGAYQVSKWKENSYIEMKANKNYLHGANIKSSKIKWALVEGNDANVIDSFVKGKTDGALVPVPSDKILYFTADRKLTVSDLLKSYYLSFNVRKPPFDKPAVRKALSLSIDRSELLHVAIGGVNKAASGIVPYKVPGLDAQKSFRTDSPEYNYIYPEENIDKAKQYLAEAGYTDMKKFPQIELIYEDVGNNRDIMQTIQAQWQKNLGLTVKLVALDNNGLKSRLEDGAFNIAAASWNGEYNDPISFLEIWTSYSIFNVTGWASGEYDTLIQNARVSDDNKVRMPLLHNAEGMLMSGMPVCPLFFGADPVLAQNNLSGFVTSSYGYIYLHYAEKQ